jgi:hypothetical protein
MYAKFMLNRHRINVITFSQRSIFIYKEFRYDEKGNALDTLRGIG